MGLFKYINDTRGEMKHVAWPTQKQTAIFTVLVIIVSLLISLYLGFFDFVFTRSLQGTLDTLQGGSGISQPLNAGTSIDETTLPEGVELTTEPVTDDEVEFSPTAE